MDKSKGEKNVYRSLREFEKKFFPKSFKKKTTEKPADARALGVSLAKESLGKIKGQLTS